MIPNMMIFEFDGVYPSRNKNANHWCNYRKMKKYQTDIYWQIKQKMLEKKWEPYRVPVIVTYDLYFRTKRKRDYDNYAPKWLNDVLKSTCFVDDNTDMCIQTVPNIHSGCGFSKTVVVICPKRVTSLDQET